MARTARALIPVAALALVASLPAATRAETPQTLPPGATVVAGTPKWIRIDTRNVSPQLLRYTFDLSAFSGRFRAFRIEADHGTIEIARAEVVFPAGEPLIDNALSILQPRGEGRVVRFDGTERAVSGVSVISSTGGRREHVGRITLHALHVPDVVVPPLPKRSESPTMRSAAR